MIRSLAIAAAFTLSATAATAHPNLFVDTGPGVTAHGRGPGLEFECSDNGRCQFEVPAGARIDITAWTTTGHAPRISGCPVEAARPATCVLTVGKSRAVLSVR